MSVHASNQLTGLMDFFGKPSQTVTFPSLGEGSVRLGDIVRMKVMRQLGDQRYSMQFKGTECIVDSSIPFSTGDVLFGKVIGFGSQTKIEKIRVEKENTGVVLHKPDLVTQDNIIPTKGESTSFVRCLQKPMTSIETKEIGIAARGDGAREHAMMAALALRNLGLNVSREMIRLVLSVIDKGAGNGLFRLERPEDEEIFLSLPKTKDWQEVDPARLTLELAPLLKKLV